MFSVHSSEEIASGDFYDGEWHRVTWNFMGNAVNVSVDSRLYSIGRTLQFYNTFYSPVITLHIGASPLALGKEVEHFI